MRVPIHESFTQTIQGEGIFAGSLCDFVRLHGCPVGCPWCDTGYSPADGSGRNAPRHLTEITDVIAGLRSPRVVITGGEPFIQPNLSALVTAILASDRAVSIETSGAYWQAIDAQAWVTLSPKQHVCPESPVLEAMWQRADEIKIVVCTGTELEFYKPYLEQAICQHIYLQPEWFNRETTIPLVMQQLITPWAIARNVRLSLQSHKYLGLQ